MASQDVTCSAVPVAVEDEAALVDGTSYTLGNSSRDEAIFWRVAAAAPASGSAGNVLPPFRSETFKYVDDSSGENSGSGRMAARPC